MYIHGIYLGEGIVKLGVGIGANLMLGRMDMIGED